MVAPTDWKEIKVGDYAHITTGKKNTQDRIADGKYPFFVRSQNVERINSYSYDGEAVLTAGDGVGTGKVFHYINGKFDCHQRVYRITDFRSDLNGKFFYLLFSRLFYDRIMSMTAKSSVDSVRMEMISEMELIVPSSIREQEVIAEALSDADAAIESLDALITKKRDVKQATMQQLLTGRTRLPGFTADWKEVRLGECLTIMHGKNQSQIADPEGRYPILATGGVIGRTNSYLSNKPSVLIGRKGTIDRPQYMDTPFWTVDTLFYSEVKNGNSAKFLFYKFLMVNWKKYNEASGVPSLNASTIENVEMMVPPLKEQEAIAEALTVMDDELEALTEQVSKLRMVKEGMMQDLLTGKVRLV